jgi:voltage-gated potassium channel
MYKSLRKRFLLPVVILIAILIIGTIGFWYIGNKNYPVIDCLYMTVLSISTIGFREVIDISGNTFGKIFTILIAFSGIGTLTFIFSNITALIVEGELRQTFKTKKMEKRAKKFENHYIICGVGRVGSHILDELYTTHRNTVVIDNNENTLQSVSNNYPDAVYINGNADVDEVLIKAGIKNAKGIFAATGDDNQNLVVCLSAKYLNPGIRVVARCLDASNRNKLVKAGADAVISENYIAGVRMASEMIRPDVVNFFDRVLSDRERDLSVEEIKLNESYDGKTIAELNIDKYRNTLLLALISGNDWIYNPKPEHVIKLPGKIVVITNPEERIKMKALS